MKSRYLTIFKKVPARPPTLWFSVRDSLSPVKLSLEKQVELFYDVQINAVYNEGTKKVMLVNNGRANVTLWAQGVGEETEKMMPYPQSVTITPNSSYEIVAAHRHAGQVL
jgi:hypothetical protein